MLSREMSVCVVKRPVISTLTARNACIKDAFSKNNNLIP